MRRPFAAALAALVAAVVALGAAVAPAAAADEAVSLSLDGDGWASALVGPLHPDPVAVPGDRGEGAFHVRNDGPTDGELTVEITDVVVAGDPADPFYTEVLLADRPVAALLGADTVVESRSLAAGEVAALAVPYELPMHIRTGNSRDGEVGVTFSVRVTLRGVAPRPTPEPTPDPTPSPDPSPTAPPGAGTGPGTGGAGSIPTTGADVAGPLALAAVLLGAGFLVLAGRRHRDERPHADR